MGIAEHRRKNRIFSLDCCHNLVDVWYTMKFKALKAIPWRIKTLITRKITWESCEDGSSYTEKVSLSFAWSLFGIHSHQWWWVHKYGILPCGCTINPLTRRFVLYRFHCPENHGNINRLDLDDEDEE